MLVTGAEAEAPWRRHGMVVAAGRTVDLETRGTKPLRNNSLFSGIVGGGGVGVGLNAVEGEKHGDFGRERKMGKRNDAETDSIS